LVPQDITRSELQPIKFLCIRELEVKQIYMHQLKLNPVYVHNNGHKWSMERIDLPSAYLNLSLHLHRCNLALLNMNRCLTYTVYDFNVVLKDILLSYITTTRILRYISSLTFTVA